MFAVPGWSVSASLLKTQTVESASQNLPIASDPVQTTDGATKPNQKRKRGNSKSNTSDVNAANVAGLYESIIEGKSKSKSKEHGEKRQKLSKDHESSPGAGDATSKEKAERGERRERKKKGKTLKEKKRERKAASQQSSHTSSNETPPIKSAAQTAALRPAPQLTPLQAKMRDKLVSARFRHLNQTLYTTSSSHSLGLFDQNPEMFTEYHEGFRRQVEVWPENPVDSYIRDIKTRAKARGGPPRKDVKGPAEPVVPLPRTDKVCRIADLGCGDAALSAALQQDVKKSNLQIRSFDLFSPSPLVTRADIAHLPLGDGSIDVAIFCLALMGTNWVDFIEEAFRVLRWKGELWVAEIKSRFGRVGGGKKGGVVEHSVGNRQKMSKKDKMKVEEGDIENDDTALMVEVDGNEDPKQETDVSAFVEVLRRRGFVLKGDDSVDLRNRMFVKMHFVKGLTPIKGKCVPVPKGMEEVGLGTWKKKPKAKFVDAEEDVPLSSEAGVLKPCVYKLR